MKLKDQMVTIREKRRLLARFVIMASRERPESNLPVYIRNYELSVDVLSRDITLHLGSDKASVMHEPEKMVEVADEIDDMENDGELRKVIMLDGMASVNQETTDNVNL